MSKLVVAVIAFAALLVAAGPAQAAALQGAPRVVGAKAYLPKSGAHAGRLVVDVEVRYRPVRRSAVARLLRARARHVGVVRVHSVAGTRRVRLGTDRARLPLLGGRRTHRIVTRRPRGTRGSAARLRLRVTTQARLDRRTRRPGIEERRSRRSTRTVVARAARAPRLASTQPSPGLYASRDQRVLMNVVAAGSRLAINQIAIEASNSGCTALYQNQQAVIGSDGTFGIGPRGNGRYQILGQFQTPTSAYIVWSVLNTEGCEVPAGNNTVFGPVQGTAPGP